MKTNLNFFPGIKIVIALTILMTFFQPKAYSQTDSLPKKNILTEITVNHSVSGSGFGFHYTPMAGFRLNKKMTVSIGPMLRYNKSELAGYIGHLRFNLLSCENSFSNKTSLYLFACHKKITNQHFSENWVELEEWVSRMETDKKDFREISFKGYESVLGFGVTHNFTSRISVGLEIGVSIYKVSLNNYQSIKLYHRPTGFNNQFSLVTKINLGK